MKRGFTLLEMLVVLVVISVAMAVVFAGVSALSGRAALRDTARRSVALLQYARSLAVASKTPQTVVFDARRRTVSLAGKRLENEAEIARAVMLDADMRLWDLDGPMLKVVRPQDRDTLSIIFGHLGTSSGGSCVIRSGPFGLRIACDILTGDVTVAEVEYESMDWPPADADLFCGGAIERR